MFGSDWQLGPEYLQFDDRSAWPLSYSFSTNISDKCKLVKIYPVKVRADHAFSTVARTMEKFNSFVNVQGIVARYIHACNTGNRNSIMEDPTAESLKMALKLLEFAAMEDTSRAMTENKLRCLSPFWSKGVCVTTGRLN